MLKKSLLISILVYAGIVFLSKIFINPSRGIKNRLNIIRNIDKPFLTQEDILELSFFERFVEPLIDSFIRSVAILLPIKKESQEKLGERLAQAGIRMNPRDYRAMNYIIIIGFGLLGILVGIRKKANTMQVITYTFLGVFGGYVYRRYSLESKITNRKKAIKSQLPEALDLLSVSVVAGLSFDQGLSYLVEKAGGPLIEEFNIVRQEINLGKPRKEALEAFAKRCDMDEIRTFTSAIIQGDELGISMSNILETQSSMIRNTHIQDIEERAAKVPVKMLIPMVIFIFPVIFIVLLGPAIPQILEALGN